MKIYYDCEFLEDGRTIELISIGLVSEAGDEYYAVNRDFRWSRIAARRWWAPWRWDIRQPWLLDNVVPSLPTRHGDRRLDAPNTPLGLIDWRAPEMRSRDRIADDVRGFICSHPDVELWADYGAYDHVQLCQLWGRMIDLPDGVPMFTHDLQHALDDAGRPPLPNQTEGVHNALSDARHLRLQHRALVQHVAAVSSAVPGEPTEGGARDA